MSETDNLTFITNFGAEVLDGMLLSLEGSGIRHKISEDATDIYGNPIPDSYALYLDETDEEKVELFWAWRDKVRELEERYKRPFKEIAGIIKETGAFPQDINQT